jgi:hypothetical protein
MQNAWGISKLKVVEKLGEYSFKVEFVTENEKKRVLDGGPWRHKGGALILVHYDGLCRSSEVRINTFQVWVCFYDLPPMMMKEAFAKQLGGQIRTYIRMDNRYPSYLRVRVEFSLSKALVPRLKVEVKGRGAMEIILRYENIPHFCFTCDHIGHAAANCSEEETEDQSIKFGEELRVSPPKRVRTIYVPQGSSRVVCTLFQASPQHHASSRGSAGRVNGGEGESSASRRVQVVGGVFPVGKENKSEGLKHVISNELSNNVKELRVENNAASTGMILSAWASERVSFRTNMSSKEESSDGRSMQDPGLTLDTTVARFHTRKFGTKPSGLAKKGSP